MNEAVERTQMCHVATELTTDLSLTNRLQQIFSCVIGSNALICLFGCYHTSTTHPADRRPSVSSHASSLLESQPVIGGFGGAAVTGG